MRNRLQELTPHFDHHGGGERGKDVPHTLQSKFGEIGSVYSIPACDFSGNRPFGNPILSLKNRHKFCDV
jgi:hypothetical protein